MPPGCVPRNHVCVHVCGHVCDHVYEGQFNVCVRVRWRMRIRERQKENECYCKYTVPRETVSCAKKATERETAFFLLVHAVEYICITYIYFVI